MGHPTWMWHPTECREGRIVDSDDVRDLEEEGWVDSPAKLDEEDENSDTEGSEDNTESESTDNPPAKKPGRKKKGKGK